MKYLLPALLLTSPAPVPEAPCTLPAEINMVCTVSPLATIRGRVATCRTRQGETFQIIVPNVPGDRPT